MPAITQQCALAALKSRAAHSLPPTPTLCLSSLNNALLTALASSLFLLPVAQPVRADSTAPTASGSIILEDVLVTSEDVAQNQPLPQAIAGAPAVVESRSAEQIRESVNLMTSAQSLKYLPSIEVRERYIGDRNGIVSTRTTGTVSSAQSLVYADDLLLSNLLGNSFNFPPRWGLVSPSEISRVDVMYGPFSALYPGNSMGGVVTMETRMPTKPEFPISGTVIKRVDFNQRPLLDRIIGYGVAAHEGQLFGLTNQLLGLLTTLGLMTLSLSALMLWWRRRPLGTLGAPSAQADSRYPGVMPGVLALLGLCLPLLGISMLALCLVEHYVLSRIAPVRNFLGLGSAA